jgi:hypothetical protein
MWLSCTLEEVLKVGGVSDSLACPTRLSSTLVLRPAEDVLNALIPELVLRDDYKMFCILQIR